MKKIMYITTLCFLLLLSGCGGYTRDETPGALRTISVADMEKKMKNKEDFVSYLPKAGVHIVRNFAICWMNIYQSTM